MTVYKRKDSGKWYCRVPVGGRQIYRRFDTESEAREEEKRLKATSLYHLHQEAQGEYVLATTVSGSIAQVLDECGRTDWADKPATFEEAIKACRCIGFENAPSQITMQLLDQLVIDLRDGGLQNGTIRKYLTVIRVMLKRAVRMGLLKELPLFPEGRTLPLPEPRDLVLDDVWIHHLMTELDPSDARLVFFLWKVGCRVQEALQLEWSRVSFQRRRIQFIRTKSTYPRQIPVSLELEALLMSCAKTNKVKPFGDLAYRTWYSRYKLAVGRTVLHLGLGKQVEEEWVCHTLRHTCLTNLAMRGASAVQIKEWAGHHSIAISNRYIHSSAINLDVLAGVSSCTEDDSRQQLSTGNALKALLAQ